ncbi:MAG: hypothetical protein ACI8VE_000093 [Natrialbaceae archaeon]|jgi:hypothetical protein
MTSRDSSSQPNAATPNSTRRATRRAALGSIGTLGFASLAGCLGALGVEPVNSEEPPDGTESGGGGRETPFRTPTTTGQPNTRNGTPESTPGPAPDVDGSGGLPNGPGVMPGDLTPSISKYPLQFNPLERVYVGPITSPPTNDWNPHYEDPEPGKRLADVAVHNSTIEDWVVSPPRTEHRIDGLELTVDGDGRFTAAGGLHYRDKCGYFGVNHLFVRGPLVAISLAYSHDPACSESEIRDGAGFWYGPISVTGCLDGDFDTLRITFLNGNTNLQDTASNNTLEFEV